MSQTKNWILAFTMAFLTSAFSQQSSPQPLVSIVMSSYNRGQHLVEAIESVKAQSYSNWELIIVDDASDDPATIKILQYYSNDTRINVHRLSHNYGAGIFAKNYGISQSKGDFIAIMDDDDISYSYRLEISIKYFMEHPEVDIIGSHFVKIGENGNLIYQQKSLPHQHEPFKLMMTSSCIMKHCTAMVRMERLKERFYYNYITAEDYDLWLRFLFQSKDNEVIFAAMTEPLCMYRVHQKQITQEQNTIENSQWIIKQQQLSLQQMFPQIFPNLPEPGLIECLEKVFSMQQYQFCNESNLQQLKITLQEMLSHYRNATNIDLHRKQSMIEYLQKLYLRAERQLYFEGKKERDSRYSQLFRNITDEKPQDILKQTSDFEEESQKIKKR